jgi:hypothetical protein
VSRRLYIGLLVLLLAAAGWRLWPRAGGTGSPFAPAVAHPAVGALRPAAPRHGNPNPPAPADGAVVDAPSELANNLNSPSGDVHSDLRQLHEIFVAYRGAVHADNPVGENVDITEVLTGRNALGFAFIPKNHPAINANGELCDRWGVPYFFHQLSGEEMEIRSAGPDHKMWTADDEVLTP